MKKAFLTLLFAIALGAAAAVGYRAGKGGLAVPAWVPSRVSTAFSELIPFGPLPAPAPSRADLKGYGFRLVNLEAKQGEATIAVELVNEATGVAVPDAVVFARRIDMAPEGMPTMTAPLEPEPGGQPGTYRFRTNLTMAGGWRLSLAAKVPGEAGTVQGKLALKAVR